jgi:hypothetical protein
MQEFLNRPLDLIDAGVVAGRMLGGHVSCVWSDRDRARASVHGELREAIIAFPPDWGLSLFVAEDAWLWINAEDFEAGEVFSGPNGPVLTVRAGDLTLNVEPQDQQETQGQ